MGVVKKAVKAVGKAVGGVLGADQRPRPVQVETKVPAQQLERKQEVGAEDIEIGGGDDTSISTAKGKRGLVRPVASSLGV